MNEKGILGQKIPSLDAGAVTYPYNPWPPEAILANVEVCNARSHLPISPIDPVGARQGQMSVRKESVYSRRGMNYLTSHAFMQL